MQRFCQPNLKRRQTRRRISPQPARPCYIVDDNGGYWRLNGTGVLERSDRPALFPSHVAADKAIWKTIEAWGKKEHPGVRLHKKDM